MIPSLQHRRPSERSLIAVPGSPTAARPSQPARKQSALAQRLLALALALGLALLALLGTRSRPLGGAAEGAEEKWNVFGVCDVMTRDMEFLYDKGPMSEILLVPTADQCCKYCQANDQCQAWGWIQGLGNCYLQDGVPVGNASRPGYWAGGRFTLPPTTTSALRGSWVRAALAKAKSAALPPTSTASTTTLASSTTTTSTRGGRPISGGAATRAAFAGFLEVWRRSYRLNDGSVPSVDDAMLPMALRGIAPKIILSSGGAAGGVVSEGMGYGIMVEAFRAVAGDPQGLSNGLALLRSWLGMVYGPASAHHPLAGGTVAGGAGDVASFPYGVSAISAGGVPAGVAAWKFPIVQCSPACQGSATDGDEDALLGMVYLAAALGYPPDFVDMVVRAVVAFASADLGFPDLFRTLPDGRRIYLPKGGSQWGGLLPAEGRYASTQEPWCYNPSYFAPGHYRTFRDFVQRLWRPAFDLYLPRRLDGSATSLNELLAALEGAVVGGYNVLQRSSCTSGAVSNWVGVKSECEDRGALNCPGVPWAETPYVGGNGSCTASGTAFGSYGPDGSRAPWRIAMDYILHTEESVRVPLYGPAGEQDAALGSFDAQSYLNGMARQYLQHAACDAARGTCAAVGTNLTAAFKLAAAFERGPDLTCAGVPNSPESWWAPFMAWPTFTAFVAPVAGLDGADSAAWLDTFSRSCDFADPSPTGRICASSYFELGQELISSMVMAGAVLPLPDERAAGADYFFK